jgi:hypothetical protein
MKQNRKKEQMSKPQTMKIDDVEYVRKDSITQFAIPVDGKPFVIVRSTTASPFFGYLEKEDEINKTVILVNARRIYEWYGAATLSQLAESGTSQPDKCKFPAPVKVKLSNVHEIYYATEAAKKCLEAVKIWSV